MTCKALDEKCHLVIRRMNLGSGLLIFIFIFTNDLVLVFSQHFQAWISKDQHVDPSLAIQEVISLSGIWHLKTENLALKPLFLNL